LPDGRTATGKARAVYESEPYLNDHRVKRKKRILCVDLGAKDEQGTTIWLSGGGGGDENSFFSGEGGEGGRSPSKGRRKTNLLPKT